MNKSLYALGVLFLLPMLSGCLALVAGAGAGGVTGYEMSKDNRTPEQVNADSNITATINSAYAQDPEISAMRLQVLTTNGIVTVKGDAYNAAAASRAVTIAHNTYGVREVRNNIVLH